MKRFPLLLAIVLGVLGLLTTARAQQTPSFSHPAVAVRVGAVQTVNESTGGLAPYVEVQSRVNVGKAPVGLALYGGISYERSSESSQVICVMAPCPQFQSHESYFDLTTGIRVGLFPREGPVDAFVGVSSHFVRGKERLFVHKGEMGDLTEDVNTWEQRTTVEGGVNVQIPVTSRFSIETGVLGFLPVRVGEGAVHIGEWEASDSEERWEVDMSRVGFQVGVQYGL